MKPYINFLILIVVAVALYTAYGLVTFKPDEPRQFVFNEPKIPAELIQMDEAAASSPEEKLKAQAIDEAQKAMAYYSLVQSKAPSQVGDTVTLLMDMMTNAGLPLYFLSSNTQPGGIRKFETLKINADGFVDTSSPNIKPILSCAAKTPMLNIIVGTSDKDKITCDIARDHAQTINNSDVLFMGGPQNDTITDANGSRIINGGTGDDVIKVGSGRTIVLLNASWGKDTLTIDCQGAMVQPSEVPKDFPIPWIYKTTNFIVLGNDINPADIEWKGENVLTHKITGDTLTVNQNCFTVIPKI